MASEEQVLQEELLVFFKQEYSLLGKINLH